MSSLPLRSPEGRAPRQRERRQRLTETRREAPARSHRVRAQALAEAQALREIRFWTQAGLQGDGTLSH